MDKKDSMVTTPNKHGFFSFRDGLPMGDDTVTEWLRCCKDEILEGRNHYNIAFGDTAVMALRWEDQVYFVVAQNNGYAHRWIQFNDLAAATLTWERWKD